MVKESGALKSSRQIHKVKVLFFNHIQCSYNIYEIRSVSKLEHLNPNLEKYNKIIKLVIFAV